MRKKNTLAVTVESSCNVIKIKKAPETFLRTLTETQNTRLPYVMLYGMVITST